MRREAKGLRLHLDYGFNTREYMASAGLVNIKVFRYKVPYGTWLAEEKPETRSIRF